MSGTTDSIRVLHVDDDPDFADLTATRLEREDERLAVETATSAGEAIERLAAEDFECIVSDYEMPGMDGIEFLEAVREGYPDLPFVLFTGKGSEAVASEAISAGVTDYLQKGGGTDQYAILANRVLNYVERARAQRQRRRQLDAIETAQEGISILDEDGHFVYVNDAYADLYGYEPEEMLGEHWELIYPDDELEFIRQEVDPILEETGYWHGETTGLRADGTTFVEDHVVSRTDRGEFVCTVRDVTDRKDRQRTLERYETIVETLSDAVWVVDGEGVLQFVNRYVSDQLGTPREDLLGRHFAEVLLDEEALDPDAVEAFERAVEDVLRGERERVRTELTLRREHGDAVRDVQVVPVESDGEVTGAVGVNRDVTGRKERERQLERERDRRSALFENATDPVVEVTLEGETPIIERINPAFEDVFGFEAGNVTGRSIVEALVPAEEQDEHEAIAARAREGEPVETEVRRRTTMGVRDFLLQVVPFDRPDGSKGGYGWYTDISDRTERERILEALHELATEISEYDTREAVCQRVIEGAETVLDFDLCAINLEEDGMLPVVATSEGVPPEGATTMSVEEGLAGKTYRTGESFLVEDVGNHPEANPQGPYRAAISVPIGEHGVFQTAAGETGAFDDADVDLVETLAAHARTALDRIEREAALRAERDRLDEFASVISHDLRNPLNVAEGRLELARAECDSEHLDAVARSHARMQVLIEDLLTLAREGGLATDVEPVDLAATVERCWRNVETAEATLVVDADRTIRADRSRVQQLLENLVRNAIEHGGADATITVGDLDDGFYVEDDGPGIPPDEREQVFESGYSTAEDGTGFGLSIVERVADAHGWEVRPTDGTDGGARFEITGVEAA